MSKINLTEEELKQLLNAINAGAEPSPMLAGKIFPSLMERLGQEGKFDFETLNRIKIPTIEYAGKRSEGVILELPDRAVPNHLPDIGEVECFKKSH